MCRLSAALSPLLRFALLDILSRSGPLDFGPSWPEVASLVGGGARLRTRKSRWNCGGFCGKISYLKF